MEERIEAQEKVCVLSLFDVAWANDQLRYGIALLHGEAVKQDFVGAVLLAGYLARRLESLEYGWQTRILRSWIHRAVKAGSFLQRAKRADSTSEGEEASR